MVKINNEGDKMYRGKKIILRAYKDEDIDKAYKFVNDKELIKNLSPGIGFPTTYKEEVEFINSQKKNSKGTYDFAIEVIENGEYIGGCGINDVNWQTRVAIVGIMIGNKDYWNNGYGTDTMNTLIRFVFQEMNINKIRLQVYSFNKRAIRCYEKCGFEIEGILKDEIYKEGKYYDEIVMSLFRKQWDGNSLK